MKRTLVIVVVAILGVVLACRFSVAVREARNAAIACNSTGHLNQIQLALTNYHEAFGCYPPAYVVDNDGKRMHSWRVLILPYICGDETSLYARYKFNEPWNGPNNSKLLHQMPKIFHMPSETESTSVTNLVVVVGPGTAFPGCKSTRKGDFVDGLDRTILATEIAHSDIKWLEPRDLEVDTMSFAINDPSKPSISSSRSRGPYVVFADSIHTRLIDPSLSPEALRALTTIAGQDKIDAVENLGNGRLTSPTAALADADNLKQL
jgi:hypothetical protein